MRKDLIWTRREILAMLGPLGLSAAVAGSEAVGAHPTDLTIYSPAPASNMLHMLNEDLGHAINRSAGPLRATVIAVPLPDSINRIGALPGDARRHHLPIVTTVDFLPAIERSGPSWHSYDRAHQDLKFVASLYDVGFGVMALQRGIASPEDLRGKRIGVPPRPSSLRVLTEALLRDGWGILDKVELVDLAPPQVEAAARSGHIAATTWNFLHRSRGGFVPLLLGLRGAPTEWLDIDESAIAAINRANPFKIEGTPVPAGTILGVDPAHPAPRRKITLLSFRQAIAAWENTDRTTVTTIMRSILDQSPNFKGLPSDLREMSRWPELEQSMVHPAALAFYRGALAAR